jgi:putative ABC transport system permease protein
MKYLHLIWANLGRKKFRTTFTLLSIVIAFLLFGILMAIQVAFSAGVEVSDSDRLITIHKVSLIQPLPISYLEQIRAVEGVVGVTFANWFGGYYQEPRNQFPQFPVDPESYLRMYPEFLLPDDQRQRWLATRDGAVVGRKTAERFGWKIGDRVPIQATIFQRPDGEPWDFEIVGIFDGAEKGTDTSLFLFHRKYFEEAFPRAEGIVGWYIERIDDPEQAPAVSERIDAEFANSPAETETTPEKAFAQGFANQIGNIQAMTTGIVSVVFFTLLLVAGNTMAQSVRERIGELAVLKTLGFGDRKVMGLVLAESTLMAVLGGGLGLAGAWVLAHGIEGAVSGFLPVFYVPPEGIWIGAVLIVTLGLVTGAVPAWQALRLRIVDALGRA